ncbi:hypothetical protein [Bacteroides oleiciplenus]|nr:hypothetical protein [Bacteroides oleiciplenus]
MICVLLQNKELIYKMKHYRQILYALGGILLLALGMLAFQVYESGVEGRRVCKQKAEASLKSATELWVNREFDKLGIPYSFSGGEEKVKSKKRRMVLAEGEMVVAVDSIKERKRLISSWVLSSKARILLLFDTLSVDLLNELWQKDIDGIQLYCTSALVLQSELPGDRNGKRFMAGDSTLTTDKFKLGTYYLDDMYFLELTAYLSVPSPWFCADWRKNGIIACFTIAALCLCVFILLFLHNRKKEDNDEANSSDDVVLYISEKKYKIGGVIFDEEACTLTFEDKVVNCTGQAYKLLSAFIHTKNHFLSNDRVVAICGWCPQHTGIDGKRRVTISHLRTFLDSEKSHVKIESGKNKQNELGFYLFVEKR